MVNWAAICIGAAALILPAWLVARESRTPRLRHAQIQALADAGCRCARRLGNVPGVDHCWDELEKKTKLLVAQAGETACYPLSERLFCPEDGGECITLNYNIVAGPKFAFCSKNEAMAAEAIWSRIALSARDFYGPEGQEADRRAHAALLDYARQVAANTPIEATQSHGCVGGMPGED
ncbi:hypothetical protein CVN68_10960 [Sphingomonas psychrotolerans]|uniref:Uncharacterized protein n=2 Tax=Sphingomonas psychrotolerans TaxID=1327635 RepID=A0A2K8MME4_9SPHN|nr:hypothetical protein CVN68_10960 [Sphingomonas psychrotolerans]